MMEREIGIELKILELVGDTRSGEVRKFSIEPTELSEPLSDDYIRDLVEEAIMDSTAEGKSSLDEIADAVVFSLKEEGYVVRDFPNAPETLSVDVSGFLIEECNERE